MAYIKRQLVNNETLIDKDLLDHIQDGIVDAQRRIDITNDTLHRVEDYAAYSIQAVTTAEKMQEILDSATDFDIGSFYMYLGENTTLNGITYKKGAVYRIDEEENYG